MLKKFLLFTIASLVMLPALADKPQDKGNKGGGAVPLGVMFRDEHRYIYIGEDEILVRDDKFGSDGFAQTPPEPVEYIDGEELVETQIDKFRFGLNVRLNGERNFFLDLSGSQCRSDPVSDCVTTSPYFRGWNVFATSPDGAQYLKMSEKNPNTPDDDDYKFVNFSLAFFDNNGDYWSIKFNPSECPGTDMVKVTKTSDNLDTWEFEATADKLACLYFREGPRKNHLFAGLYSVPFLITAQAIE